MNPIASAPAALDIDPAVVAPILRGFVRQEVGKVGFDRVVLGLSGGVDSAVVAAVAVEALGPQGVLGVLMPYHASSPASEADARAVAGALEIETLRIDVTPQIDAYFERFPDADRGRRGNKMARERMSILYDMSWAHRALVIGTSNKTELLLGYGTVHGDMAHALNPIGDLYKTQVFAMARHYGLPQQVIDKKPSADLWEGQNDEDELGFTYARADALLFHLVDERRTRAEIRGLGFDDAFVEAVGRRVRDSQYKRRLPLIAKLSARTVDREFRYPRDWGR